MGISGTDFANQDIHVYGDDMTLSGLLIGMFIHAHLILVFFRSHGNAEICKRYPIRFLAVPLMLWAAING